MTLSQFFKDHYVPARLGHSTRNTKWTYRVAVARFSAFVGHAATLADLSPDAIAAFAGWLKVRGDADRSIKSKVESLQALWRLAGGLGLVDNAPPDARCVLRSGDQVDAGNAPPSPAMTLLTYFVRYYEPLRLIGAAYSTRCRYRVCFRLYSRFLGRTATLADLDDDLITRFLGWYVLLGRSPETANSLRCHFAAIWNYAGRKRHVEQFPEIKRIPTYKRAPIAWTQEQFERLLWAAADPKAYRGLNIRVLAGVPPTLFWTSLLLVVFDTGARIGAVKQLRCSDFNAATRRLFFRAETQKQRADQVQFVSPETAAKLQELVALFERELIFPIGCYQGTVLNHLTQLLKRAGLPHTGKDKFHKIRRTTATLCEIHVGPGSATKQLGHSSARVTEKYIDPAQLPETDITAKIPRPRLTAPTDREIGGAA